MTALVLALAALALGALGYGSARNHRDLRRWLGRDPLARVRAARGTCWSAALVLLCAAALELAPQPQRAAGADAVLLVDVSRSMAVRDVAPSRLRRATRLAERLVESAAGSRFGLVIFAGDAFAALPVSGDRELALAYLRAIDVDVQSASGTDLVRGLEVAGQLLGRGAHAGAAGTIFLLSDGEQDATRGAERLAAAARELRGRGIRVVSIAVGSAAGGIVPGPDGPPLLDRAGRPVVSARRDGALLELARDTGGVFLREIEDRPAPRALLAAMLRPAGGPALGPVLAVLLAFAALAAELALALDRERAPRAVLRRLRPAALLLALCALGAAGAGDLLDGDRILESGDAKAALARYQRIERAAGASAETRVRIGNALYRLGEFDRAASAYVDALRMLAPGAAELRYAASFNLGNSLLELERLEQAREAFWTAILERPDDVEAKFNYELVLERLAAAAASPVPVPPEPGEAEEQETGANGSASAGAGESGRARSGPAEVSESEARRWLRSIDESLERPLREQLRDALAPAVPLDPAAQTW